jgi:hypothetical protein
MLKAGINDEVLDKQPTILLVLKYETREITTIVKVIHHQEKLQSLLK